MDFSIFGSSNSGNWQRVASSSGVSSGTKFMVSSASAIWLKAVRFRRPSTGVFGTIRGAVWNQWTGAQVPGTAVQVTLSNGSGPTGWIDMMLSVPTRLPVNTPLMVVVHFPGGSGNGYPRSGNVPTSNPGQTTTNYWYVGPGAWGWKNGPLYMSDPGNEPDETNCFWRSASSLTYPPPTAAYVAQYDLGLDVLVTDTDPNPIPQSGPEWSVWGKAGPNAQVQVATGQSVAGLEFTPLQEVWATSVRVYKPQSARPPNDVTRTPISSPSMTRPGGPGMTLGNGTGALYKVTSAQSGELVPGSEVTFQPDKAYLPVFGEVNTSGEAGWHVGYVRAPMRLEPGQRYRIVIGFPDGRPSLPGYFSSTGAGAQGLSVGPLQVHGPNTATGGAAASILSGTSQLAFPTAATTENPYLDVTVTTQNPNDPREPESPVRIWGFQAPQAQFTIGVGSRTVGLEFYASQACTAYGLRYFRHQGIGAVSGRLYASSRSATGNSATGTVVAGSEVTFPSASTDGWQFAPFRAPIRLAANQRYRIAVRFPAGYIYTPDFFEGTGAGASGIVSDILTVPSDADATATTNGSYSIPDQFPDQTFNSSNPWIDVTVAAGGGTPAGAAGSASEPSNALRLWGVDPPASVAVSKVHTRVVGLEFMVERAATVHGYRFYRPDTTLGGPVQARLYSVGDNEHGTEVVGGDTTFTLDDSSTGWMWAPLRHTLALVGGRRYKLVVFFPDGFPTTPGWYVDGQPGAEIDQQNGILRGFAVTNATRNAQPTELVGGTVSDAVVYPSNLATDNPWIDVTVTDGDDGADPTGEEPGNAMRAWGVGDPTGGDVTKASGPLVAAHQFTVSQSVTVHGLRMWRPDHRQQATHARLYRVDTATSVSGTSVTFPPSTSIGWVYAPLPEPVGLEDGVAYRVAAAHPVLGPATPNALTGPVTSGVVTTESAWTADGADLIYPQTGSDNNFWLDVSVTAGGVVPEDSLTLFPTTPDAAVSVRADFASTRGTTFAGQRDDRFTTAELPYWVKAIRFYRPSTAVTGTITGRIYEVTSSGRSVPVPYTDVVFTLSGTGWQTAEFPFPVRLSQVPWYRVAVHFPNGYPVTTSYFTSGPGGTARFGPNGVVYAPAYDYTGGDGIQGGFVVGSALAYPNQGRHSVNASGQWTGTYGENYWVDVVATTAEPSTAPPALPRFPLSYSQFGQISSTTVIIGETFTYSQVAFGHVLGSRSVGLEFTVDSPAFLLAYRFPRLSSTTQAKTVSARLYRVTGPTSGVPVPDSDVTFPMSADYWQSGYLPAPTALQPGQRYKAVFLFPDATPIGVGHDDATDRVRGPLRVYANSRATGGATSTAVASSALTYPTAPEDINDTPVVDVWVTETNPHEAVLATRSIFDRRRPAAITYQGWPTQNPYLDENGEVVNPPDPPAGFTAGMEFYTTTDSCFLRAFRYWRAPYPAVTQLTEFRLYRVTGEQPGNYYPGVDADYDVTTGALVPGTTVVLPEWTSDPNQTESYAEGWVTVTLPAPVPLQQGQRYRVAAWYPRLVGNKYAPATPSRPMTDFYWASGPGGAGLVDGPLIAPNAAQAMGGTQGSMESRYDEMAYPSVGVRSNRAHYWIDVEVLDTAPRNVDGGVVTVTIPTLADDPRLGGYRSSSYVTPYLAVTATAETARHTATAPLAAPLAVEARGLGGRDLAQVDVGVLPSAGGSKAAEAVVEHQLAMQYRQAARRPKGVADTVTTEVIPTATGRSSIPWSAMPREPDVFTFADGATELRFIAQNIMTRQFLHWDLPIVDPTMTWRLSGPFELTGSLNPAYIDLLDIGLDEWSTFIHVELQGQIVASGIMMPWSARGEELTIDVAGIASYPHGIPYMEIYEEFFPDIMDVIREMWRHIQSFPNGNMGVQLPTGYMGVPLYGDPVYDTQSGEFLGWKKWAMLWTDFIDCGSFIDSVAESTPFDYMEVHQWNPSKTDVLHGINFYFPRAGKKRHELRFAEGENIVEAVPITEPDDAYASDIIIKGAGEGYNQIFAWVGDAIWDRLRRVTVITDEQVQTVEVAQGMAIQELIRRLYLRGVDTVVVEAFSPLAPFGSYQVGDDILVEGMIPWVGEFGLWHRILSISLQPEAGLVTLELQRSESFRYGREITYSR